MSICKTCRNHDKCKFNFKDTVNTCSFIYPEEIPIIHGKAELEEHDKEIRNKAIDDFVKEICKMIVQSENNGNYRFYAVEIKQAIADLAEQLKAGVKNGI